MFTHVTRCRLIKLNLVSMNKQAHGIRVPAMNSLTNYLIPYMVCDLMHCIAPRALLHSDLTINFVQAVCPKRQVEFLYTAIIFSG